MKNKATHLVFWLRTEKWRPSPVKLKLCSAEGEKTLDFGNETEEDENVYCRVL